jgi:hypothetical protein
LKFGCKEGNADVAENGAKLAGSLIEIDGTIDGDSIDGVGFDEVIVDELSVPVGVSLLTFNTEGTELCSTLGCKDGTADVAGIGAELGRGLAASVGCTDEYSVEIIGLDEAIADGLSVPVGITLLISNAVDEAVDGAEL